MKPGVRLLIIEAVISGANKFSIAKLLDLEVLVMGEGKERTELEFRILLNASGFDLDQLLMTRESISVIERSNEYTL